MPMRALSRLCAGSGVRDLSARGAFRLQIQLHDGRAGTCVSVLLSESLTESTAVLRVNSAAPARTAERLSVSLSARCSTTKASTI